MTQASPLLQTLNKDETKMLNYPVAYGATTVAMLTQIFQGLDVVAHLSAASPHFVADRQTLEALV